jgi:hypothetical protein
MNFDEVIMKNLFSMVEAMIEADTEVLFINKFLIPTILS